MRQKRSDDRYDSAVVDEAWGKPAEEVCLALLTSPDGLSGEEASRRLSEFGPNLLIESKDLSAWEIWIRQFRSLIVLLLAIAAGVSLAIGDWLEAVAVGVVILINGLIGFITELRATRSMEALKKLSKGCARVRRGGIAAVIPSEDLVPGDWVVLEAGDLVPADLRLAEVSRMQCDESSLTGESVPVEKHDEAVSAAAPLAERGSMAYRGTQVTAGTGAGIVTRTGVSSELGQISKLVSETTNETTPLEERLTHLGYRLIWITLALLAVLTLFGIARGIETVLMVQTSIALAVAAIPEGLPIVATVALAHGLWKLARRNAIINRLSAVETLGATSVICTDKTGTLTQNRMKVVSIWPADSEEAVRLESCSEEEGESHLLLEDCVLCNNADNSGEGGEIGDPMEIALLEAAAGCGTGSRELRSQWSRCAELPFSSETRVMGMVHDCNGEQRVSFKGAVEEVLSRCERETPATSEEWRSRWITRNEEMAGEGMRVIAVAGKSADSPEGDPYENLRFRGLVGLIDPPREEVPQAVEECLKSGIRIVVVTGDQKATACAIADQIGLPVGKAIMGDELEALDLTEESVSREFDGVNVIARASPAQKLKLIHYFQDREMVVAMTGDGVNDAPALKQADIGIAMGLRGTDVAREASDMVLRDDSFSSIVEAIRRGRTIFSNIRRFASYLISCNLSEILVVWIAMVFTGSLPILPLQILFLNLVTDVFPALALGVTPSRRGVSAHPPRDSDEPIMRPRDWLSAGWHATIIAVATLGAFLYALGPLSLDFDRAVTVSFLTLAIAQLVHVFNMADRDVSLFKSMVVQNRFVWLAVVLCLILLAVACYIPAVAGVLELHRPSLEEYLVIAAFSSLPILVEGFRRIARVAITFVKRRVS
ncbi:MAG: cation-translocating P-type ATPase [Verrucomicrobiales bacterium]|nr:cation-translocating P-type ATPase [Verrucomicrobiales bacterium]